METHWVFNDCAEGVKAAMRAHWEKKQPWLEKLLQHFRTDLQYLGLTLYRHAQPPCFEVRAALHLPTGTMVVEESEKDFARALDRVADVLAAEIKRQVERLRRDHL